MKQVVKMTKSAAFGLESFSEVLGRVPVIGEIPGHFDRFHDELLNDLAPATPYETVLAENLVQLEWEIVQHRFMRNAAANRITMDAIVAAVVAAARADHDRGLEEAGARVGRSGKRASKRDEPSGFDEAAARRDGEALARAAMSRDPQEQLEAYEKIRELGKDPMELMGEAYRSHDGATALHDERIRVLERRASSARSDLERLKNCRPIEVGTA